MKHPALTNRISQLLLVAGLGIAGLSGVQAQEQGEQEELAGVLEEVLVTARKREESVQIVPLSVNAIDEEMVEKFQVSDLGDLSDMIVGAQFIDTNGNPLSNEIIIRGGGIARNLNVDAGTGLYANGIQIQGGNLGGNSLWGVDTFDVQRWEVLKGPQGALYGRNALGGAINVVSRRPMLTRNYAELELGYTDNDGYVVGGALNWAAVEDTLAFRFSGRKLDQKEGFYYNPYLDVYNDARDEENVRFQARWALGEAWTMDFQYDQYDLAREGNTNYYVTSVEDPFNWPQDDKNRSSKDEDSTYLALSGEYSWGQIDLIYNNRARDAERTWDLDGGVAEDPASQQRCIARGPGSQDPQRCTQSQSGEFERDTFEARALGSTASGLNWIVGADWFSSTDIYYQDQVGRGVNSYTIDISNDVDSSSIFGGADYDFSPDFNAGAEVRFTTEKKDMKSLAVLTLLDLTVYDMDSREEWDYPTWTVYGTYALASDKRVYGRVGTGFRTGGLNVDGRDIEGIVVPDFYDEEKAISYELGFKSELFDNALVFNSSIFFVDYEDFLTNANNGLTGIDRVGYVTNIGDAELKGIETELQWSREFNNGGVLGLYGGLAWMDGEIVASEDPDVVGLAVSRVPEWTFAGRLSYEVPVTDRTDVFTSFRLSSQRGGYQTYDNTVELSEPTLVNWRIGVKQPSWDLALVVTNLTDEDELVRQLRNGQEMARLPRSWFVTFRWFSR
jgi:iron complex outermembrane receptor protein